jgi:hypothetical protein
MQACLSRNAFWWQKEGSKNLFSLRLSFWLHGVFVLQGMIKYSDTSGQLFRGEAGPLFAPAEDEKPKPEPKTKVRDEDMVYRVGGQVSRISRLGELTINAGGTSVKATLAGDAKLSVDVADLSFLRVGDNIEVRGWYPAGTKGRAIATQVTASSAEPLTDPSKKKKPAPAAADKPAEDTAPQANKPAEAEKKPEA